MTVEDSERLIDTLFRLPKCDPESPGWRIDEEGILRQDIRGRLDGHRDELGWNAYAVCSM